MLDQPQSKDDDPAFQSTTISESTVFLEHEAALQRIRILTGDSHTPIEMDSALSDLRGILDKYLELPSLLDKYVEKMVNELAMAARGQMNIVEELTSQYFWSSSLPRLLSALYALSKVRGRKRIRKFLPHRVEDIHAVFRTVQRVDNLYRNEPEASLDSTALGRPKIWESMYVLWSWMGMLSLVPFKLTVVIETKAIDDLVNLAKQYLSEAGPTREMASACLASWLSRPDLEITHLHTFQGWSEDVLNEYIENPCEIMQTMGVMQTLVTIFKISTSDRETLLRLATPLGPTIMKVAGSKHNNLLLRKYLIKWWTRVGSLFMPPRVAAWRYQRGCRSLRDNLLRATNPQANEMQTHSERSFNDYKTPDQYEIFLVPDQVEYALGEVIVGLTDSSTNVRWSAAKGVGRITERLPAICSEDVLDAILELFDDREKDNDWHGACLAMAELARRGLLLPHRLIQVVPKIVEAIHVRAELFRMSISRLSFLQQRLYYSTMFLDDRRVSGHMFAMLPVTPFGPYLELTRRKYSVLLDWLFVNL